eukprot:7162471-Ditylum_brightwellii.AAC.1
MASLARIASTGHLHNNWSLMQRQHVCHQPCGICSGRPGSTNKGHVYPLYMLYKVIGACIRNVIHGSFTSHHMIA